MPGYHDIISYKGSVFRYHFKLMDENENAINISGSLPRMQVKRSPLSKDPILDLSIGGVTLNYYGITGITLTDFSASGGIDVNTSYTGGQGDTGGMYVFIPSNIMDNMPIGNWVYSLVLPISGEDENLVKGRFITDWNPTT